MFLRLKEARYWRLRLGGIRVLGSTDVAVVAPLPKNCVIILFMPSEFNEKPPDLGGGACLYKSISIGNSSM